MAYLTAGMVVGTATFSVPGRGAAQLVDAATVRVRVTDALNGDEVSGARVGFPDLGLFAETDREGIASITSVPAGDRTLVVTRAGYATASIVVSVTAGTVVESQVALNLQPLEMEGIYVNARREWSTILQFNGFAERAKMGFGKHLDRVALRRGDTFRLDRALQRYIPRHCFQDFGPDGRKGVAATTFSQAQAIPTQAMGMGVAPVVFLDGVRYPFTDLKDIPMDWVEGVEVYATLGGLPNRYANLARCGAILIWTG